MKETYSQRWSTAEPTGVIIGIAIWQKPFFFLVLGFSTSDDEKSKAVHWQNNLSGCCAPARGERVATATRRYPRVRRAALAANPAGGKRRGPRDAACLGICAKMARLVRKSDICHLLPRDHTQRLEWRIVCTRAWGWHARGTHATARAWEYVRENVHGGVTLPLAAHPRVGLAAPRATNPALCAWL